jgi:hypothetical protein
MFYPAFSAIKNEIPGYLYILHTLFLSFLKKLSYLIKIYLELGPPQLQRTPQ